MLQRWGAEKRNTTLRLFRSWQQPFACGLFEDWGRLFGDHGLLRQGSCRDENSQRSPSCWRCRPARPSSTTWGQGVREFQFLGWPCACGFFLQNFFGGPFPASCQECRRRSSFRSSLMSHTVLGEYPFLNAVLALSIVQENGKCGMDAVLNTWRMFIGIVDE